MNTLAIFGALSSLIAVIAAGTAIVAFTRASYAKATIEALRGDISDRDKRIEFLEDDNNRTKTALKRISEENQVLRDLVTNRAELAEYIAVAKDHETKAGSRHNDLLAVDEQILMGIEALRKLLERA